MLNCKNIALNNGEPPIAVGSLLMKALLLFATAMLVSGCKSPLLQAGDYEAEDILPPDTPGGFSGNSGNSYVTLSWKANTDNDFEGYWLYRNNEKYKTISDINIKTFTDEGLMNGVAYTYKIAACDQAGNISTFSPEITLTPQEKQSISIPQNFAALTSDGKVTLSWSKNTDGIFAGYELYRDSVLLADIKNSDTVEYLDSGLNNNVEYSYKMRAYDTEGNYSEYSSALKVTPADICPPVTLQGFSIEAANRQAVLRWEPNKDNDFKAYLIYQDNVLIQTIENQPAATFTSSGLVNGKEYSFHMTTRDTSGNESAATPTIVATPVDMIGPDTPYGFSARAENAQVILSWTTVATEDFAHYEIFRNGELLTSLPDRLQAGFIDDTVNMNTAYTYKIRSIDTSGIASLYSPAIQVTPVDTSPPSAPQSFSVNAGEERVTLVWAKNANIDFAGYEIFRNNSNIRTIAEQTVNNYIDTGLINNTPYEYKMRTTDTSGNYSPFSTVIAATPRDITPPQTPQNLQALPGDQKITLNWTELTSEDFERYEIYRDGQLLEEIVQRAQTTFVDNSLTNGREYQYYLRAVDNSGNISIPSGVITAIPRSALEPYLQSITSPTVSLGWDYTGATPPDSYRVYYAAHNSNDWHFYLELNTRSIEVSWNDLSNGDWDFAVSCIINGQEGEKHTSLENIAVPATGWYINWNY